MRWTAVIKEKTEKPLGSSNGKVAGYLHKGVVSREDVYVIALNGCQPCHGPIVALHGMSQFPYAAEAVFAIGPYQIRINSQTRKYVGRSYQERFFIPKPNGASVRSHAFLNPMNKLVAAIWAVDFNGCGVIDSSQPSALIHNLMAENPLRPSFLPSDHEYIAVPSGHSEYIFQRIDSNIKRGA